MDVQVWDESGKSTDVPMLYLSRQDSDFHVEFPYTSEEDKHHANAQKSGDTDQRVQDQGDRETRSQS